jgi:hypothetical protein
MCMPSGTSFTCSCSNGFSGQRCEIRAFSHSVIIVVIHPLFVHRRCLHTEPMSQRWSMSTERHGWLFLRVSESVHRPTLRGPYGLLVETIGDELYSSLLSGIDPCASQPCRNGGTCRPTNGNSFQCICPQGFSGTDCSIRE